MKKQKECKLKKHEIPKKGEVFGYWTVIDDKPIYDKIGKNSTRKIWKSLCRCKCGTESYVRIIALRLGTSKGCRCRSAKAIKDKVVAVGELSQWKYGRIQKVAKNRGWDFTVSMKYLWDLFVKQKGKCALSGIELILKKSLVAVNGKEITMASLDRIDSNKGYIEGNVQWVHSDINRMKRDFSDEYFISLCKLVANNN